MDSIKELKLAFCFLLAVIIAGMLLAALDRTPTDPEIDRILMSR